MRTKHSLRGGVPGIVLLLATAVLVARLPAGAAQNVSAYSFFDPIVDVARLIDDRYYEEVDLDALQAGAIRGMVDALGDPYTEYIPLSDLAEFEKQVRGDFVGIGAEVRLSVEGYLLIVSPLDGSPALEAGLQAGDRIVGVDGVPTYRLGTTRVISMLTGAPGTEVVVTVERDSTRPAPVQATAATFDGPHTFVPAEVDPAVEDGETSALPAEPVTMPGPAADRQRFDVVITRSRVQTQTVRGLHRDGERWRYFVDPAERIAYVRISQFTEETARETPRVLADLVEEGMRGLVLDLRGNTGGSLSAAVRIADLFLHEGTIVSLKGKGVPEQSEQAEDRGDLPRDVEVVVLVDGGSASASEVLTGALKDNGRAVVLGERTFGKGLVQQVISLPTGAGQLKVTEANYYLPSGQSIHRKDDSAVWGVDPSPGFYVPLTPEQAFEVWTIRREQEVLRPESDADPAAWEDSERIRDILRDPQLDAATEALVAKLNTGSFLAPNPDASPDDMMSGLLDDEQARLRALEREMFRVRARITALRSTGAENEDAFYPTDAQLAGGSVVLRDADGNNLMELDVTGAGLDRWLRDAPVTPRGSGN